VSEKMKNRGLKTGKKIGSKGRSGFFALEIREEDRRRLKNKKTIKYCQTVCGRLNAPNNFCQIKCASPLLSD